MTVASSRLLTLSRDKLSHHSGQTHDLRDFACQSLIENCQLGWRKGGEDTPKGHRIQDLASGHRRTSVVSRSLSQVDGSIGNRRRRMRWSSTVTIEPCSRSDSRMGSMRWRTELTSSTFEEVRRRERSDGTGRPESAMIEEKSRSWVRMVRRSCAARSTIASSDAFAGRRSVTRHTSWPSVRRNSTVRGAI